MGISRTLFCSSELVLLSYQHFFSWIAIRIGFEVFTCNWPQFRLNLLFFFFFCGVISILFSFYSLSDWIEIVFLAYPTGFR